MPRTILPPRPPSICTLSALMPLKVAILTCVAKQHHPLMLHVWWESDWVNVFYVFHVLCETICVWVEITKPIVCGYVWAAHLCVWLSNCALRLIFNDKRGFNPLPHRLWEQYKDYIWQYEHKNDVYIWLSKEKWLYCWWCLTLYCVNLENMT